MERNLNRRVETLWPVRDAALLRFLRDAVLESYLRDNDSAMVLRADGEYEPAPRPSGHARVNAQAQLLKHSARSETGGGPAPLLRPAHNGDAVRPPD